MKTLFIENSALDIKILSNWVFWFFFTCPFLIELGIRVVFFSFGYLILLVGARNTVFG